MALGNENEIGVVNLNDSAELYVFIYGNDDDPVPATSISSVDFVIQRPDETQDTAPGIIRPDGSGFLRYLNTNLVGSYIAVATFTLNTGEVRSGRIDFEVTNPFEPTLPSREQKIADAVWLKLEDCFDSIPGGPWLRDQTLAYFNKDKIPHFIEDALFDINSTPPTTNVIITEFTTDQVLTIDGVQTTHQDPDMAVLVQGTLLAVIRHLIRSYVEQPEPRGANVVWQDRRDYIQRWQSIYQIEMEWYRRILALWKRKYLNLGQGKLLISSKAGRLLGPGLRARSAQRGFW